MTLEKRNDNPYRWIELAVPVLSFGGAIVGVLFWVQGIFLDFHYPAAGCVLSSWILAYLAWIRPKKDIVALSTPVYSFIFFVAPTDFTSGIILQLLYAASLTILLVRLKYRFGRPGTAASLGKELADPLKTYIGKTGGSFTGISPEEAHSAAVVFVRFAQGEYSETVRRAGEAAIGQGEKRDPAGFLVRAFSIAKEHSALLDKSLPRPVTYTVFRPEDSPLLAKPQPPSYDDDSEFETTLDNALLLLFAAAWNNSEADRPHLLSCQPFAQKLMSSK
jgi:hypothetical protein